jgi:hypothetical protein
MSYKQMPPRRRLFLSFCERENFRFSLFSSVPEQWAARAGEKDCCTFFVISAWNSGVRTNNEQQPVQLNSSGAR